MQLVRKEEPHLLVLMGPFIDERHKIVESGNLKVETYDLQYSDLFASMVTAIESALSV